VDRIGTLLGRVAVLSDDELQELEDLVLEEFHAVGSDPTKAMGVTEAETLESLAAAGRPSDRGPSPEDAVGRPRNCRSTSPGPTSPAGPCPSPARPSRRSGLTGSGWSSPPRSGHRSNPAMSYGTSKPLRASRPPPRHPAHSAPVGDLLPARGRHAHGRPGAPRSLVLRDHGRHLQPRRSGPAVRGRRPSRSGAPLVTAAVPRAALLYGLLYSRERRATFIR
jgi:hypothetical protein